MAMAINISITNAYMFILQGEQTSKLKHMDVIDAKINRQV